MSHKKKKRKRSKAKKSPGKKHSSRRRSSVIHATRSLPSMEQGGLTTPASVIEAPSCVSENFPNPRPGVLLAKPRLSVCMIVRDEETVLARCLESVQTVSDELIVVDTGSIDTTISVAEDFGAKIFHFEWCDDFSAARNESLKHATCDWILQIDADEEMLPESISPLRKAMSNQSCLLYLIGIDFGPEHPRRFNWAPRLFRNHPGVRYARPYHETVDQSIHKIMSNNPRWRCARESHILIRHHWLSPLDRHDKNKKASLIMESYVKKHPDDAYMIGQLGILYAILGLDDKGESFLRKALQIDPSTPDTNYLMGVLLQKKGKVDAAVQFFRRAASVDPFLSEARFQLGKIWLDKGHYDEAIKEIEQALSINPDVAQGYSNLGLAYVNKGMHEQAIAQLKKATSLDPELANAHLNLGLAYAKTGLLEKAIAELKEALRIDPEYGKAHYNLAIVYFKKGAHAEAVMHCDTASGLEVEIHPQLLEWLKPYRK